MMKRYLSLLSLLIGVHTTFANRTFNTVPTKDTCGDDKAKLFRDELKAIIDSVDCYKIKSRPDYRVFIARFYHLDTNKKDFCFTISYIVNSKDYERVKTPYYLEFADRVVLIRLSDSDYNYFLPEIRAKKLDPYDDMKEVQIVQKLYPNDISRMSWILSHPFSTTVVIKNCEAEIKHYRPEAEPPQSMWIYKFDW